MDTHASHRDQVAARSPAYDRPDRGAVSREKAKGARGPIVDLQRAAGNRAVAALLSMRAAQPDALSIATVQRADPESHDFSDEEGSVLRKLRKNEAKPRAIIDDSVGNIKAAVEKHKRNMDYSLRWMQAFLFSESSEATKIDAGAEAAKFAFDAAVGVVLDLVKSNPATKVSVAGIAIEIAYDALKASNDAAEKAAKAAGSVAARDWLIAVDKEMTESTNAAIEYLLLSGKKSLHDKFNELGDYDETADYVMDDQARYLEAVEAVGTEVLKAVPNEPPDLIKQRFLASFVTDKRAGAMGLVESSSWFRSGEFGGQILLEYNTVRKSPGNYEFELESAELVSSSRAGQVTDAANKLIEGGLKVYELGIPVKVRLQAENMVGGRSYFAFWIYSPDNFTRTHWHRPAQEAWVAMPWSTIESVSKLTPFT